jgi:hypothetical protein
MLKYNETVVGRYCKNAENTHRTFFRLMVIHESDNRQRSQRPAILGKGPVFIVNIMNAAAAAAGTVSLFKDLRKSTEGALDRAKLVLNREPNNGSGGGDNNENDSNSVGTGASAATPKTVDRLEELSEYCPQLTFQQRLIGFAASFSLGCEWLLLIDGFSSRRRRTRLIFLILCPSLSHHHQYLDVIAFFSFRFFIRLLEGRPMAFALNYTFGRTYIVFLFCCPCCCYEFFPSLTIVPLFFVVSDILQLLVSETMMSNNKGRGEFFSRKMKANMLDGDYVSLPLSGDIENPSPINEIRYFLWYLTYFYMFRFQASTFLCGPKRQFKYVFRIVMG